MLFLYTPYCNLGFNFFQAFQNPPKKWRVRAQHLHQNEFGHWRKFPEEVATLFIAIPYSCKLGLIVCSSINNQQERRVAVTDVKRYQQLTRSLPCFYIYEEY
jgi:hypothetical protein